MDSLVILERVGNSWDSAFYLMLRSMSGKWRAGQVDGIKRNETITIWYNIYKGLKLKKDLTEYLEEGRKSISKADYEKALRNIDLALEYDALNVEALILKARSLYNLNQKEEACKLMKSTLKYENEKLTIASREFCD